MWIIKDDYRDAYLSLHKEKKMFIWVKSPYDAIKFDTEEEATEASMKVGGYDSLNICVIRYKGEIDHIGPMDCGNIDE